MGLKLSVPLKWGYKLRLKKCMMLLKKKLNRTYS